VKNDLLKNGLYTKQRSLVIGHVHSDWSQSWSLVMAMAMVIVIVIGHGHHHSHWSWSRSWSQSQLLITTHNLMELIT
jgi:hypothetical protein